MALLLLRSYGSWQQYCRIVYILPECWDVWSPFGMEVGEILLRGWQFILSLFFSLGVAIGFDVVASVVDYQLVEFAVLLQGYSVCCFYRLLANALELLLSKIELLNALTVDGDHWIEFAILGHESSH